jgi:hypothetical protein
LAVWAGLQLANKSRHRLDDRIAALRFAGGTIGYSRGQFTA